MTGTHASESEGMSPEEASYDALRSAIGRVVDSEFGERGDTRMYVRRRDQLVHRFLTDAYALGLAEDCLGTEGDDAIVQPHVQMSIRDAALRMFWLEDEAARVGYSVPEEK